MSKSNVNPNHYKVAGRERQGEDIAQARNKQKHAHSLARRRSEGDAGFRTTRADAQTGVSRRPGAGRAGSTSLAPKHAHVPGPRGAVPEPTTKQATTRAQVKLRGADRTGKRSTAPKRAKR
jgi:hypothetical protein